MIDTIINHHRWYLIKSRIKTKKDKWKRIFAHDKYWRNNYYIYLHVLDISMFLIDPI